MDENSLAHTKWDCKYHIVLHQSLEDKKYMELRKEK